MKPSYNQLENKVKFYRVTLVVSIMTVLFIVYTNMKTTEDNELLLKQLKAEVDLNYKLNEKFDSGLCLPRLMD